MKRIFFDPAVPDTAGGDPTAMVLKAIEGQKAAMQESVKGLAKVTDIEPIAVKAATDAVAPISVKLDELDKQVQKLDEKGGFGKQPIAKKSFGEALAKAVEENMGEVENFLKKGRGASMSLQLKDVGSMTLSGNLTGDAVATYNQRQGLVPAQKVNIRDLMPTVQTATGLYVTYRETGTEGAIAVQTEGDTKGQIDYDLTEVKVVQDYIAGWARVSKQMLKSLPFMEGTLPRMLLRDFYKVENSTFYTAIAAAATGATTSSAANSQYVQVIMDLIANQLTANFDASYALISHSQNAAIQKELFANGYYPGSGGVVGTPSGGITISGVPLVPVSWVPTDKILVIDRDYLERIEAESLNVQFSFEDDTNFQKNLVTVRVECLEDINILRPDAIIYADLGDAT